MHTFNQNLRKSAVKFKVRVIRLLLLYLFCRYSAPFLALCGIPLWFSDHLLRLKKSPLENAFSISPLFKNSESSSRIRFADVTFKESPARARFSHILLLSKISKNVPRISVNTDNYFLVFELLGRSAQLL